MRQERGVFAGSLVATPVTMARLESMFSRPLVIDCTLTASESQERVRRFATSRDLPQLEAFRRRQIVSWRLSRAQEDFLFQPEYGNALDVQGARFVGLVEAVGSGSRIRGRVVAAPVTRLVMSIFILAVGFAAVVSIGQRTEPVAKVLAIAATMVAGAWLMVRYSLRSTGRLVEARLRQCLEAVGPRAAA